MATPVKIQASGVVLRGEGMGDTGTILIGTGTGRAGAGGPAGGGGGNQGTLVLVGGASGVTTKDDTKQTVTDDYVPVGARSFKVLSARGFRPGDTVVVRRIGNQDWIDAMGMNAASGFTDTRISSNANAENTAAIGVSAPAAKLAPVRLNDPEVG